MMDFTSWKAIATQSTESRLFGSVHFNYDNQLGLQLGKLVYDIFFRIYIMKLIIKN